MATELAIKPLTAEQQYDLDGCALEINKAEKNLAWALLDIGKAAAQAQGILAGRTGAFAWWVQKNSRVGLGLIYGAIRARRDLGHLDFATVAKFHVRAIVLLTYNNTPEVARTEAIERAESGETITADAAKEIKERHRKEGAEEIPGRRGVRVSCPNCGGTERDEDGECLKCLDPCEEEASDDAEAHEQEEEVTPRNPFAALPYLPADVSDAFESFKLSIARHRLGGWREISQDDMTDTIEALLEFAEQ